MGPTGDIIGEVNALSHREFGNVSSLADLENHPRRQAFMVQCTRLCTTAIGDDESYMGLGLLASQEKDFGVSAAVWFKNNGLDKDKYSSLEVDFFTFARDGLFGTRDVEGHRNRKGRIDTVYAALTAARCSYQRAPLNELVGWLEDLVR